MAMTVAMSGGSIAQRAEAELACKKVQDGLAEAAAIAAVARPGHPINSDCRVPEQECRSSRRSASRSFGAWGRPPKVGMVYAARQSSRRTQAAEPASVAQRTHTTRRSRSCEPELALRPTSSRPHSFEGPLPVAARIVGQDGSTAYNHPSSSAPPALARACRAGRRSSLFARNSGDRAVPSEVGLGKECGEVPTVFLAGFLTHRPE
jgi:hypothetical protein